MTGWWLAGGIDLTKVVAVYQAKGVASEEDALVNLNDPGINNLSKPTFFPSWNVATGWTFDPLYGTYLYSGVSMALKPFTMIARINPTTAGYRTIFGCSTAGGIQVRLDDGTNVARLLKATVANVAASNTGINSDKTIAVSYSATGDYIFYLNGVNDGSGTNDQVFSVSTLQVGRNGPDGGEIFRNDIYALAIYNAVLSLTEVQALHDAMQTFAPIESATSITQSNYLPFGIGIGIK